MSRKTRLIAYSSDSFSRLSSSTGSFASRRKYWKTSKRRRKTSNKSPKTNSKWFSTCGDYEIILVKACTCRSDRWCLIVPGNNSVIIIGRNNFLRSTLLPLLYSTYLLLLQMFLASRAYVIGFFVLSVLFIWKNLWRKNKNLFYSYFCFFFSFFYISHPIFFFFFLVFFVLLFTQEN